jgi:hypothetical protein
LTRIDRYLARLIFVPLVATLTLAAMLLSSRGRVSSTR